MRTFKIMVFASGSGSNSEKMFAHFKHIDSVEMIGVVCNKANAGVLDRAKKFDIPAYVISNDEANSAEKLIEICAAADLIILAGYLRKIPIGFIQHFEEKIINVHPSLLPNYGGKGMYGAHVHRAVLANNEPETGITIHFVNEHFDEGRIIAQFRTKLSQGDDLESVQQKIQFLEHNYFPYVVEQVIKQI